MWTVDFPSFLYLGVAEGLLKQISSTEAARTEQQRSKRQLKPVHFH
jgi:hypothetical protein